jgi:hypothetical protein
MAPNLRQVSAQISRDGTKRQFREQESARRRFDINERTALTA